MKKNQKVPWKPVTLQNAFHISRKNNFNFAITEHMILWLPWGNHNDLIFKFYKNHNDLFCIFPFKYCQVSCDIFGKQFLMFLKNVARIVQCNTKLSRRKSNFMADCRPGRYFTQNKDEVGAEYWWVGSWENFLSLLRGKKRYWNTLDASTKNSKVMDHLPTPDKCSLSSDFWSHAISAGNFNNLSWSPLLRLSKPTFGERSSKALAGPRVWIFTSFLKAGQDLFKLRKHIWQFRAGKGGQHRTVGAHIFRKSVQDSLKSESWSFQNDKPLWKTLASNAVLAFVAINMGRKIMTKYDYYVVVHWAEKVE